MIITPISEADYKLEIVDGEEGGFRWKLIPKQRLGIRYIDVYGFESDIVCNSVSCATNRARQWARVNGIKRIEEEI